MRVPRRVTRAVASLALAMLAAAAASEPAAPPESAASALTIVDLQPFRTQAALAVRRDDDAPGTATLVNLNPYVNSWFLLTLDWEAGGQSESFHLENARRDQQLTLAAGPRGSVLVDFGDRSAACRLPFATDAGSARALETAQRSGLPFAPLCDGRLYLRNPTVGRSSTLEKVTDFLRDHVWGGERVVTFVKKELYRDAFVEQGEPAPAARGAATTLPLAPAAARIDPARADLAVAPPHLGLAVDAPGAQLLLGRWYALRGLDDAYFSVLMPEAVERGLLYGHEASVNPLSAAESTALVYLVAFDLAKFDLHFTLGTDHPRLGWSPRPPPQSRDPRLPGPDGIDSAAPLVITGMVPPTDTARTVAAFAGGFKREHGAFRFGPLAERNHGSHYGFVEQGVLFSKLQPGLATVYATTAGAVDMGTWTDADRGRMAGIRDARQNGVPLLEFDARRGVGVPGPLVNLWGEGNWSGSANEDLRTVRAGLCLLQAGARRHLVFAYFSSASPSAMARVFQAYGCRYAMHLDMNALEHTYFALYVSQDGQRVVEHLIDGMDVLDRHSGEQLAPRFLGFPDNRDFFYVTRRAAP
jgi:hypothetical protein